MADRKLICETLPPYCGYPFPNDHSMFHVGGGCGNEFKAHAEVYRCADCNVPMHQHCLIYHFADGKTREVSGYGQVKAPHHVPHHFAPHTAWIIEQVLDRDKEIQRLKSLYEPDPSGD